MLLGYMLWISGYNEMERFNNVKGALLRIDSMKAEVAKASKGGLTSATWFLNDRLSATVTCQATPGSKLATALTKRIGTAPDGSRRVVLDEGGCPVTLGLKACNPFKEDGCQFKDPNCLITDNGDCSKMKSVYVIRCKACHEKLDPDTKETPQKPGGIHSSHYIGLTTTSVHNRMIDHRRGHLRKDAKNPLHRHDIDKHNGQVQQYETSVIQSDRGLLHLIFREAIQIEGQNADLRINDKNEHGRGDIIRLTANR